VDSNESCDFDLEQEKSNLKNKSPKKSKTKKTHVHKKKFSIVNLSELKSLRDNKVSNDQKILHSLGLLGLQPAQEQAGKKE